MLDVDSVKKRWGERGGRGREQTVINCSACDEINAISFRNTAKDVI
jgi:hypothetical protein